MKLDPHDPRLTAYLLNELDDHERAEIEAALAHDDDARRELDSLRQFTTSLTDHLDAEPSPSLTVEQRLNLHAQLLPKEPRLSLFTWRPIWLAGGLTAAALILFAILLPKETPPSVTQNIPLHIVALPAVTSAGISATPDQPFLNTTDLPHSTFPATVATVSYDTVRTLLNRGQWPPLESVRIEELINYFPYHDPEPTDATPLAARVEVAACPWNPGHRLARIGLKTKPVTDLAIQVEFNPAHVTAYRLIGYDQPTTSSGRPAVDEHTVVALYEIIPAPAGIGDLFTLTLRTTDPGQLLTIFANNTGNAEPSADFQFTAAVAAFGMLLRDKTSNYDLVLQLAQAGKGNDPGGQRAEFIELVKKARQLAG